MNRSYHVALLVTCLVDFFRPRIGFAAIKLLKEAGCRVSVPVQQTCCGQPAYNSGDTKEAKAIAKQVLSIFQEFDYIVVPSGSCAGMLRIHYPRLFSEDLEWLSQAQHIANRTYELTSFLVDVLKVESVQASYPHTVTYHDACSGLRELGIKQQPRQLLQTVNGITVRELPESEVCCGFGGTFCVKYSEISNKIVTDKINHMKFTQAETLLAGDLGCLMNMEGKLQRDGNKTKVLHVAEVLADMTEEN